MLKKPQEALCGANSRLLQNAVQSGIEDEQTPNARFFIRAELTGQFIVQVSIDMFYRPNSGETTMVIPNCDEISSCQIMVLEVYLVRNCRNLKAQALQIL